jgi:hypothetical protein
VADFTSCAEQTLGVGDPTVRRREYQKSVRPEHAHKFLHESRVLAWGKVLNHFEAKDSVKACWRET